MLHLLVLLGIVGGVALGLGLLFLPTLIAKSRRHPSLLPIFLVNLFFGWTFVGWVISLVWALTTPVVAVLYAPVYPATFPPGQTNPGHPYPVNARNPQILPPTASYQGPR